MRQHDGPARRGRYVVVAGLVAMCFPAPASAAPAGCAPVFAESWRRDLARSFPGRVTAAVYDTRTGCWHHLNPGMQITTASVIKAQVLAALLLKAQDEQRGLTGRELALAQPMIRFSHDPPTSVLYGHIGGTAGMAAYDLRAGISTTSHSSRYGGTSTTAQDRTRVALGLLHSGGPLRQTARDEAWRLMGDVHPTQQWGITAGMRRGWSAALKNGFYPGIGDRWRVGSTGFVREATTGHGYAITVMSTGMPDQATGIRLVETVAARVAAVLTGGRTMRRPVDRAVCARAHRGQSWAAAAVLVGVPGHGDAVRVVSGGGLVPFTGQRVCAPSLAFPRWREVSGFTGSG